MQLGDIILNLKVRSNLDIIMLGKHVLEVA